MTSISDPYAAGVDAIIVDNALSRSAFLDIIRTFTDGVNNAEAGDWVDAVAGDYFRLALISNNNYNQLRNSIITDDAALAKDKFNALLNSIGALPESAVVAQGIRLQELRAQRDSIAASITTMQGFRSAQTQQVIDAINIGINALQAEKENLRTQIQAITGDPDS